MIPSIEFFTEGVEYSLPNPDGHRNWISGVLENEGLATGEINYIFCSDNYLHEINLKYLHHDTFTDIITFDLSEEEGIATADIYISVERVTENAQNLNEDLQNEIDRVMIHGILHLCGYSDHSETEKKVMRKKEDACLSLRKF